MYGTNWMNFGTIDDIFGGGRRFRDEASALSFVEATFGPGCPLCGVEGRVGKVKPPHRGRRKCYACRKQFSVRRASIFESSHVPVYQWLRIIHLMAEFEGGISVREVQRRLSCSTTTASKMVTTIREGLNDPSGNSEVQIMVRRGAKLDRERPDRYMQPYYKPPRVRKSS